MRTFNTTGVVLKRSDFFENDRLFVIYTRDYGKIEVVAKGTKKILSKLNPHLEPLTHLKIMVAKGRGFDKLANATTIDSFSNLKYSDNLHLTALMHYALEITDRLLLTDYRDANVYENLVAWLNWISSTPIETSSDDKSLMANAYILKLLSFLGFQPELRRCVECARGLIFPKITYDFMKGGVICEHCKQITLISEHYDISDSVIKMVNIVTGEGYSVLDNYRFNSVDVKDFNNIVYKLALYQIDKPLLSTELLKFVQKMAI